MEGARIRSAGVRVNRFCWPSCNKTATMQEQLPLGGRKPGVDHVFLESKSLMER